MRMYIGLLLTVLMGLVAAQGSTSSAASSGAAAASSTLASTSASMNSTVASSTTSPTGSLYSNNPNIGITQTLNYNTMTYSYTGKPLITVASQSGLPTSAAMRASPIDAVKGVAVAGLFAALACFGAALV